MSFKKRGILSYNEFLSEAIVIMSCSQRLSQRLWTLQFLAYNDSWQSFFSTQDFVEWAGKMFAECRSYSTLNRIFFRIHPNSKVLFSLNWSEWFGIKMSGHASFSNARIKLKTLTRPLLRRWHFAQCVRVNLDLEIVELLAHKIIYRGICISCWVVVSQIVFVTNILGFSNLTDLILSNFLCLLAECWFGAWFVFRNSKGLNSYDSRTC